MKKLSIVLMLTIVLGMAGCNTEDGDIVWSVPGRNDFYKVYKESFDKCREQWTEQGISDYSFYVVGREYRPLSDARFCAHVTVADGSIVSIENYGPNKEELDAYTWGAIPDIFDKILSISMEEASSPYPYDWDMSYDKEYGFPNYIYITLPVIGFSPYFRPPYSINLEIGGFQVTEKTP